MTPRRMSFLHHNHPTTHQSITIIKDFILLTQTTYTREYVISPIMKCYNPFSFVPGVVTISTAVVYLAILIALVSIHETVPAAPLNPTSHAGLNLTEAWQDLRVLTRYYHPFNSRRNDHTRDWLLRRIDEILRQNSVQYSIEGSLADGKDVYGLTGHRESVKCQETRPAEQWRCSSPPVTIFNDVVSNYTNTIITKASPKLGPQAFSTYFEANNIIVYVRGTEDEEGEWWKSEQYPRTKIHGKGGVMVNTHFDSVSTGFGATDAGVGVITVLQLIKYLTTDGHTPKKGFVALLNNNEEDGLYGANAFLLHPMASFVHTFLNLEGAGAGGRPILFRSTDTEVTRAYAKTKRPFGTVLANDAYSAHLIRSETDYSVFKPAGYRGLDVAFWRPRARYHTYEDDARDTSIESVWAMLSLSVDTVNTLTSDTSNTFSGSTKRQDERVPNGHGTSGVWFDIFGASMLVFQQRTLFAWSLTILITTPLILAAVTYLLIRYDRYYLFSNTLTGDQDHGQLSLGGWRGFTRFPIAVTISSMLTIGAAFLLRRVNPLIIYSSSYNVWAMSLSLFFVSFWFMMAGSNYVRPSALHRCYALFWMFIAGWGILVVATVFEDRYKMSSGYLVVIYEAAIFLAFFVSLCELFALPTKASLVEASREEEETREGLNAVPHSDTLISPDHEEHDSTEQEQDEEPTERTSLLGGKTHQRSAMTTFNRYRRSLAQATAGADHVLCSTHQAYGHEQKWSAPLPSWTWIIQFLLIGPFMMIIIGNVGLTFVAATNQTGVDGSALLLPYLLVAIFTILWLLPLAPFVHRISHHIPTLLFAVFLFTLVYNLTTFPFTPEARYKAYFQQTVDLDTGINHVSLDGIEEYVRMMIDAMPSAAGQNITCAHRGAWDKRSELSSCSWQGIAPEVIDGFPDGVPPEKYYQEWLSYSTTRVPKANKATFQISGKETRNCVIRFDGPISAFKVHGAADHGREFTRVPDTGTEEIRLWSREWDKSWTVDVEWHPSDGKQPGDEGRTGRVVCLWNDHNGPGIIPALDEVMGFCPIWSTVTKRSDGLVEGSKAFVV